MLEWLRLVRPRSSPETTPEAPPKPEGDVAHETPAAEVETAPAPAVNTDRSTERELVTATLASLAMRDLTLVDSLLAIVEELEDTTEDPDLLSQLFKIDNLATRMRRNGENLLVLAGQESSEPHMEPVALLDVARAATSEISDYERVRVGRLPEKFLVGPVADDLSHLLAELMDNATAQSPDHAQVVVTGQPMSDGRLLLAVEDEGIGIPQHQLDALNRRLSGTPVLDEEVVRHMGLYVVSRIAHRHGLQVQLEARSFRGISAFVVVPATMVRDTGPKAAEEPAKAAASQPVAAQAAGRPATAQPQQAAQQPVPAYASTAGSASSSAEAAAAAPSTAQEGGTHTTETPSSAVTSAGLPRRSANRSTSPMPVMPTSDEDGADEPVDPASRAEQISSDLGGFLEGEREAGND